MKWQASNKNAAVNTIDFSIVTFRRTRRKKNAATLTALNGKTTPTQDEAVVAALRGVSEEQSSSG
jgi:hypothetical protein